LANDASLNAIVAILLTSSRRAPRDEHALRLVADALRRYDVNSRTHTHGSVCFGSEIGCTEPEHVSNSGPVWCRRDLGDDCVYWQGVTSNLVRVRGASKIVAPPELAAAVEESRVLLLTSSWTLASTIGLLVRRYLPSQMPTVDDVISRIERDLELRPA
jgi:hypothetical protein